MRPLTFAVLAAATALCSTVALAASDSPLTRDRVDALERERNNDLGAADVPGAVGTTDRGDIMENTGPNRLGGAAQAPRPGLPDRPDALERGLGTTPEPRPLNDGPGNRTGDSSGAIGSGTRLDGDTAGPGTGLGSPGTGLTTPGTAGSGTAGPGGGLGGGAGGSSSGGGSSGGSSSGGGG